MSDTYIPYLERPHDVGSGVQKLYRFANGYGASVVRFMLRGMGGSYGAEQGLWELGVLVFKNAENDAFHLVYDTPVTNDVRGYLTDQEVEQILAHIAALPADPDAYVRAQKRIDESRLALLRFSEDYQAGKIFP